MKTKTELPKNEIIVALPLQRGRIIWDLVADARVQIDAALDRFGKRDEDNLHVLSLREFRKENNLLMIRYMAQEMTKTEWAGQFGSKRPKVRFCEE